MPGTEVSFIRPARKEREEGWERDRERERKREGERERLIGWDRGRWRG